MPFWILLEHGHSKGDWYDAKLKRRNSVQKSREIGKYFLYPYFYLLIRLKFIAVVSILAKALPKNNV